MIFKALVNLLIEKDGMLKQIMAGEEFEWEEGMRFVGKAPPSPTQPLPYPSPSFQDGEGGGGRVERAVGPAARVFNGGEG